jgi:hypothetical protein
MDAHHSATSSVVSKALKLHLVSWWNSCGSPPELRWNFLRIEKWALALITHNIGCLLSSLPGRDEDVRYFLRVNDTYPIVRAARERQ